MHENKIMNIKDAPQKVQEVAKLMETKEGILNHVQYGIVNKRWSKDFIEKIPHKSIQDLAIIYNVVFDTEGEIISGRITNELLKLRGITVQEMVEAAQKNSPDITVQSMGDVMREMCLSMGVPYEENPDALRQYVITNEKKYRGAYAVAMPEVFEDLANEVGSDLVIIPSSVHELLAMPMKDVQENMNAADLENMIREVNETQVPRKEWLSDRPYFYKRGSMQISFMQD